VNGLDCYYESILVRDRRRREDSKDAPRAKVLLVSLFDFYISLPSNLSIRARSSSLSVSTSWYLAVHSPLARDKSAYRSGHHLTIQFAMLISVSGHSLQRYNKFQSFLSQSSFQNQTNWKTLLVKTEIGRLRSPSERTCAAKRLLDSDKVKDLTGTAEAFVLDLTSQL